MILQRELWRVGPEDLRPAGVRHVSLDPEAAGALCGYGRCRPLGQRTSILASRAEPNPKCKRLSWADK